MKALEALATMAEVQNKQTAEIVTLAVAFGASQAQRRFSEPYPTTLTPVAIPPGRHVEVVYNSQDIVSFLKNHSITQEFEGDTVKVRVTRKGDVDA